MRMFIKTMTVLAVLCAIGFAQEINFNLQQEPNPLERYNRFSKMKNVGTGLIIGGVVIGTTGVIMSSVNLVKALDYEGLYIMGSSEHRHAQEQMDKYEGRALVWLLVGNLGYSAMAAGIPIRIVGRVRANRYRYMLPNSAHIVPNGAQFVWNF